MAQKNQSGLTLMDVVILIVLLVIIAALSVPNFSTPPERAKVSRVLNDVRTMRSGIEAYAVDHGEFPRMTWCDVYGDNYLFGTEVWHLHGTLMPGPAQNSSGRVVPKGIGGAITTPIAYLNTLPLDPFGDIPSAGSDTQNLLYMYWNAQTYKQILEEHGQPKFTTRLPYAPDEAQLEAFERELGQYVIWSIGPAGWEDFEQSGRPIFLPYDPTNGTISSGSVFVSQKLNQPGWVDYEALEPAR